MTEKKLEWTADPNLAAGKGATVERFTATHGKDSLEIETHPWGEGDLKVNGKEIAHVADDTTGGEAFQDLEAIAEDVEAAKNTAASDTASALTASRD